MNNNLTFGEALEFTKKGRLIARQGWNGKNMFVFMRPSDSISVKTVVENIKSLPDAVKDHFRFKYKGYYLNEREGKHFEVKFNEYLCMKAADDTIVNGWLASQTDLLASDWCVLD